MNNRKNSIMHKITAVGFILVTLAGNFWLMYLLLGNDAPAIVVRSFESGLLVTAIGGLGMLFNYVMRLYSGNRNGENN